jgi:3-oxoacyl-[acyl-carrier-protein] synthase-3
MIGITQIGTYFPQNTVDNIAQAAKFGESEAFIKSKIGATVLPRLEEHQETSDLAVGAVENLLAKNAIQKEHIEALVVVTQNGDFGGLPHTAAIVQSKLGLPNTVSAFDISLGCSGYVYGLSILKAHMQEMGFEKAVLITADPYSKIVDQEDRVTSLLFGDGATATLLSHDAIYDIGKPILQTDGNGHDALVKKEYLSMHGRKVFNFAATNVPKQIAAYLDTNKLTIDDIDLFLLHQGSAAIVDVIARKVGGEKSKFILDIETTGNTVSSTIPILLEKQLGKTENKKIIISGFGVGLSWATNLLERR